MPVENWFNVQAENRFAPKTNMFKRHYEQLMKSIEDHHRTMVSLHPDKKDYFNKFREEQIAYWNKEYPEFAAKGGKRRQTRRKRSRASTTRKH